MSTVLRNDAQGLYLSMPLWPSRTFLFQTYDRYYPCYSAIYFKEYMHGKKFWKRKSVLKDREKTGQYSKEQEKNKTPKDTNL